MAPRHSPSAPSRVSTWAAARSHSLQIVFGALVAGAASLSAQEVATSDPILPDSTLVDRIAAVVGDSVILVSQVQSEMLLIGQSQTRSPQDVLEALVEQQLVLQAAAKDSTLVVTDEEIEPAVEQQIEGVQANFGTPDAFRRALTQMGLTEASYRDEIQRRARNMRIMDLYRQKALRSATQIAIDEAEMRDYYEEHRGELGERPELITLQQVFVPVELPDSVWEASWTTADSLRQLIEEGADFAELAAEHSSDPGSAQNGGDLGWFRRGLMVREFDQVAFSLRPGTVSFPVRSAYGHHIIRVERSRPGEVKARHILITPEVTSEDRIRARDRAEEVAVLARAGGDMLELYDEHGDPEEQEEFILTREEIAALPYPGYAESLASFEQGDVIGPFLTQVRNDEWFVVVRVKEIRKSGEITFEDVRDQIQQLLRQQKQLKRVTDRLRSQTYVDIRM